MKVVPVGLTVLTVLAAACSRPAPGAAGGASTAAISAGMPAGAGQSVPGGMMEGAMGGMPNMMGASTPDTSAAPRTVATTADSAADCPPVSQSLVNLGRSVFSGTGNCFACHAANAKGTTLAPDLTDTTWLNINGSYAAIVGLVRTGVAKPKQHPAPMPPMGGAALNGSQVCDVAAYVYSLSHG